MSYFHYVFWTLTPNTTQKKLNTFLTLENAPCYTSSLSMLSANVHLLTSCFVNFPKEFTEYKILRGTKSSAVTKSPVESRPGKMGWLHRVEAFRFHSAQQVCVKNHQIIKFDFISNQMNRTILVRLALAEWPLVDAISLLKSHPIDK